MFGDKLSTLFVTPDPVVVDVGNRLENLLYQYQNGVNWVDLQGKAQTPGNFTLGAELFLNAPAATTDTVIHLQNLGVDIGKVWINIGTNEQMRVENVTSGSQLFLNTTAGALIFAVSGTTQMSISAAGITTINAPGGDNDTIIKGQSDDNLVYVDASADKVGFGVADPSAKVDILSTTEQLRLSYDADSFTSFTIDSASTLKVQPAESGKVSFQPTTDSTTFFQIFDADGGVPIFSVDAANEEVGIGTASPTAKFHVLGVAANTTICEFEAPVASGLMQFRITNSGAANIANQAGIENRMRTSTSERSATSLRSNFSDITDATRTSRLQIAANFQGTFNEIASFGGDGITFNETGWDVDIRFEASGQVNALFIQGSEGNIGIWNGSPANQFNVNTPANADATADIIFQASANTQTPLVLMLAASQSARAFEIQDESGNLQFHVSAVGGVNINAEGNDANTLMQGANSPLLFALDAGLDVLRFGDFTTNYTQFAKDGSMTQVGASTVVLFTTTSGDLIVGEATKQTNSANLQIGGAWTFKETTAPTADAGYAKIWTETNNELFLQTGDGQNHLLHGDAFSEIWFHNASTVEVTISAADTFTQIDSFTVVGNEDDLANVVGSVSTNDLTLSAAGGGEYEVSYHMSMTATGGADKEMVLALGITLATPKDITNVTDDTITPIVITSVAHGLENGDMVEIAGVLGNTAANGSFIVDSKAADTFVIVALDGTATTGNGDFDEGSPTGDVTIEYPGNMVVHREVRGASLGALSATGLHVLANSDKIALYVANLDGTTNLTVAAVSFDAFRIGD